MITAKSLGAEEFGALAIASSVSAIFTRLFGFQSWHAIIKFGAPFYQKKTFGDLASLFKVGMILDITSAIFAGVFFYFSIGFLAENLAWSYQAINANTLYVIVVLSGFIGAPTALLRIFGCFGVLALHSVYISVIRLFGCVVCALWFGSFYSFLLVWVCSQVLSNLALLGIALNAAAKRNVNLLDKSSALGEYLFDKKLLHFFVVSNLDGVLKITREIDVVLVGFIISEAASGVLRVAKKIASIAVLFMDSFFNTIYPELAKLWSLGVNKEFLRLMMKSSLFVGGVALSALLLFFLLGEFVVQVSLGRDYEEVYAVCLLLLCASSVWGFVQPVPAALMSMGLVSHMLRNHFYAASIYMILLPVLVLRYGTIGAAIAFCVFQVVWAFLSCLTLKKNAGLIEIL